MVIYKCKLNKSMIKCTTQKIIFQQWQQTKINKKLKIVNNDKPNNSLQKIKILLGQQTKILAEKVSFDNSIWVIQLVLQNAGLRM